jgi:SAM-dependent methyltransferase
MPAMAGWPFWAATSDERIERALDLAGLGAGEHLVDLGCGDGRVLLRAAAFRDARVTGVELDAEMAATARQLLADHDVDGDIIEADFATVDLGDADVVFAYLSPATLQRLEPLLAAGLRPGARLVTTGYAVPGWEPEESGGRCYLYRQPFTPRHVERNRRGWDSAGVLVALTPDAQTLVGVKLHATGGPLDVRVADGELAEAVAVRTGDDHPDEGDEVVVDLRFDARPLGTRLAGALEVVDQDLPAFQVFAVVVDGPTGVWGVSRSGCDAVATAFSTGDLAATLAEARASTPP